MKLIKTKSLRAMVCALIVFFCCLFPVFFSGCVMVPDPITKSAFFFNTYITITFYSEKDAALFPDCENLCRKYEGMLSRTAEGSDIWNLNHADGKPVVVSEEAAELITDALSYCEYTDGAVDITIAPLM